MAQRVTVACGPNKMSKYRPHPPQNTIQIQSLDLVTNSSRTDAIQSRVAWKIISKNAVFTNFRDKNDVLTNFSTKMSHSQQICRFLKYDKIWQKRSVCVQIGLFRTESIIYVLWNYSQFFIMIENLFSGCVFLCTCYDGFLFECFFFLKMLCSIFERFWLNCEHWNLNLLNWWFHFPGSSHETGGALMTT